MTFSFIEKTIKDFKNILKFILMECIFDKYSVIFDKHPLIESIEIELNILDGCAVKASIIKIDDICYDKYHSSKVNLPPLSAKECQIISSLYDDNECDSVKLLLHKTGCFEKDVF